MRPRGMETLIGRDRELGIVDELLDDLKQGRGVVLYVEGEPGIGKTALVSQTTARAAARRCATVSGRGAEFERDLTLGVFADVIEPGTIALDDRHRLLRDVRSRLEGLGHGRPLLIALDDVHWADPASVDLICHILHRPLDGPVMVVLAARARLTPSRLMAALEEAERRGGATRLELRPLAAAEAAELLGDGID